VRTIFADSGYWIALLSPKDTLHNKALSVSRSLGPHLLVTTEMVLSEVAAFFSDKGEHLRAAAAKLIRSIRQNPNIRVVPQTSLQFQNALALYEQVSDKDWSLVDCASFEVMRELSIMEALAHDQHFEQNGFVALLRS
jgi:predicted nucleic acid-binding protein